MAHYVAVQNGDFTDLATWGGSGAPVNDLDTFHIPAGITVVFDADLSGLANGLGASTIAGELQAKRTAGTYVLKLAGVLTIQGGGKLDASDGNGGAYQADASFHIITAITIGGFKLIDLQNPTALVQLICHEPAVRWAKLTSPVSSGATVLTLDTNVQGEDYWTTGSVVGIDSYELDNHETRTIASVNGNQITLSTPLSVGKPEGSYVVMCTRNIKIHKVSGGGTYTFQQPNWHPDTKIAVELTGDIGLNFGSMPFYTPVGGCIHDIGVAAAQLGETTGGRFNGVITGCQYGLLNANAMEFSDAYIGGCSILGEAVNATVFSNCLFVGGVNGFFSSSNLKLVNCKIIGNEYLFIAPAHSFDALNCQFEDIGNLNFKIGHNRFINCKFTNITELMNLYKGADKPDNFLTESIDHNQVQGVYKAWCKGGRIENTNSVVAPGRAESFRHICEYNAPIFMQREVTVSPGKSLRVRAYVRKDTLMDYLPRVITFRNHLEPFYGDIPDLELVMTNSIDTWEVLEGVVTNITSAPVTYSIRTLAKNATGNVYFDLEIFGDAGVSRARLANS